MKRNIAVLDYSSNTVDFHNEVELPEPSVEKNESEIIEDYLMGKEYHLSNCSWMTSLNQIAIIRFEKDEVKTIEVAEPYSRSISWSVEDFVNKAEGIEEDWREIYDEEKFSDALDNMIEHHDANEGIGWSTVQYYLDEFCKKGVSNG